METGTLTIAADKVVSRLTLSVRVTGLPAMKLRWWIGSKLLVAAAAVIGCKLEVEII